MLLQTRVIHPTLLGTLPLNSQIQIIMANYEANQQPINTLICKRVQELKKKRVSETEKNAGGALQERTHDRAFSKKGRRSNKHVDILA